MEQQINRELPAGYIETSIREYKEGLGRLQEKLPDVAGGYMDFTGACFQEGVLGRKEKQLIALGIGIFSQDEYCIMYHTKGALDNGATEQEVLETVAVAAAFGGGAAISQGVTLVMDVVDHYRDILPS